LDNGELTSLNVRNIREQTLVWQQRLKQSAEKAPDSKPD
jgi:hypothetical protein